MPDLNLEALFPPVSKAQWTQQVVADLKGKPFESLKRMSPEGFEREPFYTAEDRDRLPLATDPIIANQSPGWLNVPRIQFHSVSDTNTVLRDALAKGADGLLLDLTSFNMAELDWKRLLNGLKLSETPVWFQTDGPAETLVAPLLELLPYQLKGGIIAEPFSPYLRSGAPPGESLAQLAEATRRTLDSPQFRTITVSSHVFHNAGANATQELAFLLNTAVDLYDSLTDAGLSVESLLSKTMLSVSVGTSYFTEIAKLRALRVLWQRLISGYQSSSIVHSLFLHGQTSTFHDATATPYTNLLRGTTEAMAAVIGGCDALTVHPYDTVFGEPNAFSSRIARNISILLKEEAHLDKTLDPAAGSYYLETLTHQLAESAWALFLAVENRGGLQKAFEQGFIQNEIETAYQANVEAVRNGRVLVGVTKFRMDEESAATPIRQPDDSSTSTVQVLPERRLAAPFE
ncbi:methylmalonyl-CoA mutase [Larkinella arboricola]|uniref:Methylmalonyl-CoA mutase n=1 Tax=Larkinella arboricola TaxID=643671 RepID=A0A327X7D2_LARAB|nr:methylmalonyl-CoA mutase family protein [Larkinella arboricola]RAK03050.1 methylmalonyl-CoA mutase [Larkinella arboricola]